MVLLVVSFFSIRRIIKVLYHQFDDLDFIDKESGDKIIYEDYLIKRTIMGSMLAGFLVCLFFFIIFFVSS